ncbi:CAZyme family GH64 [Trichoderma aggressivum f. europaeum]|uniref:CAZyme family GH64 n=1 Tax=Trichoderma aggressivum f. europaeum TaxID=173218 RepID=A0AAE1M6W9_9HYPO|nr:CAZyme family GH64 [Trichoderma aggressivum f. europaeum]
MQFASIFLMAGIALSITPPDATLIERGATLAEPGQPQDVVTTDNNILNGTYHPNVAQTTPSSNHTLPLQLVNKFSGGPINAYIQGLDMNGAIVFITADGSLVYPSSSGSSLPVEIKQDIAIPLPSMNESITLNLSIPLNSGRIYFCEGNLTFAILDRGDGEGLVQPSLNSQDPSASLNWGFIELTYPQDGSVYANISYVDFVGLILSMVLSTTGGGTPQITRGLQPDAVPRICYGLYDQSLRDDYHWLGMCVMSDKGRPIRVISPNYYHRTHESAFKEYWTKYVDQVWETYSRTPLIIDTQREFGNVTCLVADETLRCANDPHLYLKPSAADIWGCNGGPFARYEDEAPIHLAIVPRLCAGFVRSTLLLHGGHVQPSLGSEHHYMVSPTNHYSRLVHELQLDGRGYAFSYDDVNPNGNEDASGTVAAGNPSLLTIYVGSPPTDV